MKQPRHVAIILDGNRRWAKLRNMPAFKGHYYGLYKALWPVVLDAPKQGIEFLTVWGFSTENWNRKAEELDYLFKLFERGVRNRVNRLNQDNIRIKTIGELDRFPDSLQQAVGEATERTAGNTGMTFTLALSYGGRRELVSAAKQLATSTPDAVTEESFGASLYDPELPDIDLIIRTSGERRLSGFMPWQAQYAELYFTDTMWPDFRPKDLAAALADFATRQRRFGH